MLQPLKNIEVFSSGTHTDKSRKTRTWTPDQLRQIAARYNAKQYPGLRAPATLGHPEDHHPAYGYVREFRTIERKGDDGAPVTVLVADFEDFNPDFFAAIQRGEYSTRSLSVDPNDLTVYHVAWLGAALPAVAGLKPVAFHSRSKGALTYSQPVSRAATTCRVDIMHPGTHTDTNGNARHYPIPYLREIARHYNEGNASQPAPACHARTTGTESVAGRIARLEVEERPDDNGRWSYVLVAEIDKPDNAFFQAVRRGDYSRRRVNFDPRTLTIHGVTWSGATLAKLNPPKRGAEFSRRPAPGTVTIETGPDK